MTSCNNRTENVKVIEKTKSTFPDENSEFKASYKGSGKLIQIDSTDSKYTDAKLSCKDTITKNGWKIEYLVKDDKTKYDDLYIKWSKGNLSGIFCSASTLIMRRYFIPEFEAENENYLFLTHGCSTSGAAVLVLPKNTSKKGKDYSFIIDYSIKYEKIGYIPERSFSLNELEITIADLKSGAEKSVVFENICTTVPEESCVDQITFGNKTVEVEATLIDKNDVERVKNILEKHKIKFK